MGLLGANLLENVTSAFGWSLPSSTGLGGRAMVPMFKGAVGLHAELASAVIRPLWAGGYSDLRPLAAADSGVEVRLVLALPILVGFACPLAMQQLPDLVGKVDDELTSAVPNDKVWLIRHKSRYYPIDSAQPPPGDRIAHCIVNDTWRIFAEVNPSTIVAAKVGAILKAPPNPVRRGDCGGNRS